jgi:hypothetical protein
MLYFLLLCFLIFSAYKKPISISENGVYPSACLNAAVEQSAFESFKRNPYYNLVQEYHTFEEGIECLTLIQKEFPDLLEHVDKFRSNDALGNPRTYEFETIGRFSPTTLYYVKLAGELRQRFGSLNGMKVLEIGGGYGGLCKVLSSLFTFKSYTIVDLPESLKLAEKYLHHHQVASVRFIPWDTFSFEENYDLVISDFGFSDYDRKVQSCYLMKQFGRSQRGYLACSFFPKHFKVRPYNREELLKQLSRAGIPYVVEEERPLMGQDHIIIFWDGFKF